MSKVVQADSSCPNIDVIEEAVRVLRKGGLIVMPTDTVYGLIADPFNEDSVLQVYKVKERSPDKPLPILLAEAHHALMFIEPNEWFWKLALRHWPGPLTIVSPPKRDLPRHLRRWEGIGVRLPDCILCRIIAKRIGGAVIGTSANISGAESPRTVSQAMSMLGDQVDLYIDGGPTILGVPSTVVDVRSDPPTIVREGYIRMEHILS